MTTRILGVLWSGNLAENSRFLAFLFSDILKFGTCIFCFSLGNMQRNEGIALKSLYLPDVFCLASFAREDYAYGASRLSTREVKTIVCSLDVVAKACGNKRRELG